MPGQPSPRPVEDYLFAGELPELDPDTDLLCRGEADRETEKLVLIASESICPPAVRRALTSAFTNLYAEGYPSGRLSRDERANVVRDRARHLAFFRRYSDRRFYKGTEYADLIEALAQQRAAEAFATDGDPKATVRVRAADLFVNVQALSGAAANNAVYTAFAQPGDTVVGLALPHGGHLTHGSPFNRSGRLYRVMPYTVHPETGRLDYDQIERLVREHRPRLLIAGASAYPWHIDWPRLRAIADQAPGCLLLADIAHPAGLVAAGLFPSPVGHAHVVSMTTHKTLCGPRGALLLTTDAAHARAIDRAVFPGEQGGPHVNTIAAIAVSCLLARTEKFKRLQRRIVENAAALAAGFRRRGLVLAYGGTETHLCLVDLNALTPATGIPLKGAVASNLLDLCGLTTNRNTIPGDETAADSSALRFGTTFVSQRGLGPDAMDAIAGCVHRVLTEAQTFQILGKGGWRGRARLPIETIEAVRAEVAALARAVPGESVAPVPDGHVQMPPRAATPTALAAAEAGAPTVTVAARVALEARDAAAATKALKDGAVVADAGAAGWFLVEGERARAFLDGVGSARLSDLVPGQGRPALLLRTDVAAGVAGQVVDDAWVFFLSRGADGRARYLVRSTPANRLRAGTWLRALSDGYVQFDADLTRKIEGPVVVEDLGEAVDPAARRSALALIGPKALQVATSLDRGLADLAPGRAVERTIEGAPCTVVRLDAAGGPPWLEVLAPPGVIARLATRAADAGAVRGGAAALAAARASLPAAEGAVAAAAKGWPAARFDLAKPYFVGQAAIEGALGAPAVQPAFAAWPAEGGALKRTPLYDIHAKLGAKLVPFAGWEMPVVYAGADAIAAEHTAVREAAGIFDVAHMGTIEVTGPHAERFLDVVTTNYVPKLKPGQSHYSYALGPDGMPIDDIIVYRRGVDRFLVVVNASNHDRVMAWLSAVNGQAVALDPEHPGRRLEVATQLTDLKTAAAGDRRLVDIALQGPRSLEILRRATSADEGAAIGRLRPFTLCEATLVHGKRKIPAVVSRSGYTGEPIGYELMVHPDAARDLWDLCIALGGDLGCVPAGLGARDSTRTEAGFPLYGHELGGPGQLAWWADASRVGFANCGLGQAGPAGCTPFTAGYGAMVKWHKPFFVGRAALQKVEAERRHEIVRFELPEPEGLVQTGDVVTDRRGGPIGLVTSCCWLGERQVGLALVDRRFTADGTKLATIPRRAVEKPRPGKYPVGATGTVVPRFLVRKIHGDPRRIAR